ncbi:AMP-binding protein [Paractinoplanes atraurantiacus]|uniref:Acyl-CoA synthetase (AMP-forming)/AMP-acid ligase II n=1 Tax=Paractinoplanes atraurantiacus TaxID=1036182 RepID=A0A285IYN0_9ACTN|nr:AMP-binding protein [Actinoplanes atraurantiacus]SNY53159.1 Acyl-CoA synthetase (AMP-forming)/AMP-acid ligase II [Actinoplanes atraurantiacus]
MFVVRTMARRGLLNPGHPVRIVRQFAALGRWGFGLAGELRQAAARSPGRVAVIDEKGPTTYAHLLNRSSRLAAALPFGPGDRVGLLRRNSASMVESLIAVTQIGADPVLMNTGLSAAQLAVVVENQQLSGLIYDDEFAAALPSVREPAAHSSTGEPIAAEGLSTGCRHDLGVLGFDGSLGGGPPLGGRGLRSGAFLGEGELERLIAESGDVGVLRPPVRAGRTIVLTSGTTGTPKGARRPTPGGFSPLCSIIDRIPLRAGVRVLIAAPLFHTWGFAALQIAIALRATIVLRRRFEPGDALDTVAREKCSALIGVPVMVQQIMEQPVRDVPLSVVAVSGSALPGGLATRFMDRYGDILYNLYGSTEASWASIATPADMRAAPSTAGRPPHGTVVRVLDEEGGPVPAGETGRLFVGNEMLFEGYTNASSGDVHDGLLATGDVGHLDEAGRVFIDGRADDMIVSGGENVFPSEVENLLADLPQVREVAVIGVPDEKYGQRLAAYVVPRDGATLDEDQIREHVRSHRARFCVPRDVVFLKALPRNATGKVLTRDLPRP